MIKFAAKLVCGAFAVSGVCFAQERGSALDLGAVQLAAAEGNQAKPSPAKRPQMPKMELKVKGGRAVRVPDARAGHPLGKLPGAKQITFPAWAKMKQVPKTGLYLVDTGFVPPGLESQLKEKGFVLRKDGTLLDAEHQPITLFIKAEVFEVEADKVSYTDPQMREIFSSALEGEALAANPYPFSQFSWSMWWHYRGGFCRDYRAWTVAEAWGPEQSGSRPHTRIEYIETRAEIGSRRDRDSCYNCDYQSSYARWDIGCWWPAHGGASGFHYANWKDGSFSATRTWSWSD